MNAHLEQQFIIESVNLSMDANTLLTMRFGRPCKVLEEIMLGNYQISAPNHNYGSLRQNKYEQISSHSILIEYGIRKLASIFVPRYFNHSNV